MNLAAQGRWNTRIINRYLVCAGEIAQVLWFRGSWFPEPWFTEGITTKGVEMNKGRKEQQKHTEPLPLERQQVLAIRY